VGDGSIPLPSTCFCHWPPTAISKSRNWSFSPVRYVRPAKLKTLGIAEREAIKMREAVCIPAIDGQSGRPASRRELAICAASAGALNGSLFMNCRIEKSGLIDKQSATLSVARSMSPSCA
jgi:hypothetical protein